MTVFAKLLPLLRLSARLHLRRGAKKAQALADTLDFEAVTDP